MKKAIYITIGLCIVLIAGGVIVSNYAVDFVLRSLGTTKQVSESTVTADTKLVDSGSGQNQEQSKDSSVTPNAVTDDRQEAKTNTQGIGSAGQTNNASSASKPGPLSTQSDSSNNKAKETDLGDASTKNDLKYSAEVSTDKAKKVEDSITIQEKAQVTAVLLRKLSASEIQLFIKLASDGLSVQEKREAKKIILQKLTEDEYNQLISIAAKYGLSEGKSYKESQKEVPTK